MTTMQHKEIITIEVIAGYVYMSALREALGFANYQSFCTHVNQLRNINAEYVDMFKQRYSFSKMIPYAVAIELTNLTDPTVILKRNDATDTDEMPFVKKAVKLKNRLVSKKSLSQVFNCDTRSLMKRLKIVCPRAYRTFKNQKFMTFESALELTEIIDKHIILDKIT